MKASFRKAVKFSPKLFFRISHLTHKRDLCGGFCTGGLMSGGGGGLELCPDTNFTDTCV